MALTKITGEGVGAIDSLGIGTSTNAATLTVSHASGTDGRGIRLVNSSNNQTYENRIGTEGIENTSYSVRDITADVVRFSISSDGEVTMPSQPCFSATASINDIPLDTLTTIPLSSERFDVGSNLASNTFTAPVTGKYLFTYMFYFFDVDADHTSLDVHIKTSNKQYQQTFSPDHFVNTDTLFSISGSVIADMDANDTLIYTTYIQGGSAISSIHGDSQVSGCLLV